VLSLAFQLCPFSLCPDPFSLLLILTQVQLLVFCFLSIKVTSTSRSVVERWKKANALNAAQELVAITPRIGGHNHQLRADNQLASEMGGARYAAFSEHP